ncbi:MAG: exonuclease [Armatimonadetes bacterium]|nr:exonuclease [Armatimonadota bacterium]
MLTSTFLHIPGITGGIERSLWRQGATTWDEFQAQPDKYHLDGVDTKRVLRALDSSWKRLQSQDFRYFRRKMPMAEHWRVFPEFSQKLTYLDIETDGGSSGDSITMVGVFDGKEYRSFVKGCNLEDFPGYIENYGVIVTFFGSGFDVPMLSRKFPWIRFDMFHIDLCPTMRRLGLRGGLKKIERQLGISRSVDTQGLSGRDAIFLWNRYVAGDEDALDRLIKYNEEDVVNLEKLMRIAYHNLRSSALGD